MPLRVARLRVPRPSARTRHRASRGQRRERARRGGGGRWRLGLAAAFEPGRWGDVLVDVQVEVHREGAVEVVEEVPVVQDLPDAIPRGSQVSVGTETLNPGL
eukprot:2422077-Rhodomonas_salina.1